MALIYRSILEVDRQDGDLAQCEQAFRDWLKSKFREQIDFPDDGESHVISEGSDATITKVEAEFGNVLRGKLRESKEKEDLETTVTCVEHEASMWIWVDLHRLTDDAWGYSWVPLAPRLVKTFLGRWSCRRANNGLADKHHVIEGDQGELLASQILDEQREVPVVVVSPTREELEGGIEQAVARGEQLQLNLAGIAPIYVLGRGAVSSFSKAMGGDSRGMDVHSGAMRSYLPKVGSDSDSAWRHRVVSWNRLRRNPVAVARRHLAMPLIRASANQVPPEAWERFRKLPEFSPGGVRDDDYIKLAELAEREAAELKQVVAQAEGRIDELEVSQDIQREEEAELLSRIEDLERRLRYAQNRLRERGEDPEAPDEGDFRPETCAEVFEYVVEKYNFLELGPAVEGGVKELDEHAFRAWAIKAFQAFRALQAYAKRKNAGWGGDFRTHCKEAAADSTISLKWIAMSESETTDQNPKFRRLRTLPVDAEVAGGGEIYMPAHIKIDQGGNPAPRIHFYDDTGGSTGKIHIGWFGRHLDNKSRN